MEAKPKKERPNAFVALKITDKSLLAAIAAAQAAALPLTAATVEMPPVNLAHVTLCITRLDCEERREAAAAELARVAANWNGGPVQLHFKGVDVFGQHVAFARVDGGDLAALHRLRTAAADAVGAFDEGREYIPHLTLAKSRDAVIMAQQFSASSSKVFGSQTFNTIQLLKMGADPESGNYPIIAEETFASL